MRLKEKCFNMCSGEFCLRASQQINMGQGASLACRKSATERAVAPRQDATKRISPLLMAHPLGSRHCTTFKEINKLRCY
ncbi:hypothetical protein SRHO_G00036100 [Serrasalmus rhombeus]